MSAVQTCKRRGNRVAEILRAVWVPSSHKQPLTRQCMKLWNWRQICNEKQQGFHDRGGALKTLEGDYRQGREPPRHTMWSAVGEVPVEHSQAFGTYTASTAWLCPVFWTAGFADQDLTGALLRYWFHPILPRLHTSGNGMLMSRYHFLKVCGLLLAYSEARRCLAEDFEFRRFKNTRSGKIRWFSKINNKHFWTGRFTWPVVQVECSLRTVY